MVAAVEIVIIESRGCGLRSTSVSVSASVSDSLTLSDASSCSATLSIGKPCRLGTQDSPLSPLSTRVWPELEPELELRPDMAVARREDEEGELEMACRRLTLP